MNYRNLFSIALLLLLPICNSACTGKSSSQAGKADTVVVEPMYKLYPTTNNWNFLKLNTADGRIWIVQYAINDDSKRFDVALNKTSLLPSGTRPSAGRFTLIPTSNIWNFILLDQVDGRQWQVQWGLKEEDAMVLPIPQSD